MSVLGIGGSPSARPPSSLAKVPTYTPGAPAKSGLFIRFAHPPATAAHLVVEAASAADARPPDAPRRLRRRLVLALFLLAATGFVVDVIAGYGRAVFLSILAPFAIAGLPVALALTIPAGAGLAATVLRKLAARRTAVVLVLAVIGLSGLMMGLALGADARFWTKLAAIVAYVLLLFGLLGSGATGQKPTARQRERLDAARVLLETLGDDVAPAKAITGWVDLTGPEQKSKLLARGTASSGAEVEVFRDEWLHLSAPLRDGTRLRVAAVERQKVKLPRWARSGSGKYKRKSRTVARTLATVEVRVRIDPRRYRTKPPPAPGTRIGRVTVSAMEVTPETVSGVFVPSADAPEDMLDAVAAVFAQLERATPGAQP